ncbi:DMT family transporter [Candidatus Gracilibacteria bacterium]|nr:DMT family transporter [Candidatus Gracilibacteria bacterium]
MKLSNIRGEYYLLAAIPFFGLFPVFANIGVGYFPPLFFAGISNLIAALVMVPLSLTTKRRELKLNRTEWLYTMGNTVFNIILPFILIYIGTQYTSSLNTTLLHQTELLSAFIINGLIFGEVITRSVWIGGVLVLSGTLSVLYNGSLHFNIGDLLIIASTFLYPFGNIYAKKSLKTVTPWTVLFLRSLMGGTVLLLLSGIFEASAWGSIATSARQHLLFLFINGAIILGFSKWLWLSGMRSMPITKSTIFAICGPPVGILYSILFLKEVPSIYQAIGFLLMILGLWVLVPKRR